MNFEYRQVVTGDGSPTLSVAPTWERMHAEEGAFTERQFLYQPLAEKAFRTVREPIFLSLGLGLGYNELLIAFESIHRGKTPALIASYELVDFLRETFLQWIKSEPSVLAPAYDQIAEMYSQKYGEPAVAAKSMLLRLFQENRLQFFGAIETANVPASHAILFDAFSPKTSPKLWTPEFLERFFSEAAAKPCFVATHACNVILKKALIKNGFTLDIHKGFGRKRESLAAYRLG